MLASSRCRDGAYRDDDPRVPDNPFDAPSGDLFADVPLLRELQRVCSPPTGR